MRLGGACRSGLVRFGFTAAVAVAAVSCTLAPPDQGPGATVERAVLPMAQAALDAGQFETARRLYSRLLEVDEGSVAARMGLGRVAMADRDASRAASWYLAAAVHAASGEERHDALLAHGRAALAAGQHEAALRSFSLLASPEEKASDTHAAWAHNGVGMVRWLSGDPRGAVAAIERAVLRDPEESAFRSNLAAAVEMLSSMALAPPPARPPPAVRARDDASPADLPADTPVDVAAAAESDGDVPSVPTRPSQAVTGSEPVRTGDDAPPPNAAQDAVPGATPAGPGQSDLDVPVAADAERAVARVDRALDDAAAVAASPTDESEDALSVAENAIPDESEAAGAESGEPGPHDATVDVADATDDVADYADDGTEDSMSGGPDARLADTAIPPDLGEFVASSGVGEELDGEGAAQDGTPEQPPAADLQAFLVSTTEGQYVQAGAYGSRERADALARKLRGLTDIPVAVRESEAGGVAHRVRIGPLDVDELPSLEAALEDAGFGGIRINTAGRAAGDAEGAAPVVVAGHDGEYLQVGAYGDLAVAEALAARLEELTGEGVSVTAWTKNDGTLVHRVRIGPLDPARSAALADLVGAAAPL